MKNMTYNFSRINRSDGLDGMTNIYNNNLVFILTNVDLWLDTWEHWSLEITGKRKQLKLAQIETS